jgi:hypothetical protein
MSRNHRKPLVGLSLMAVLLLTVATHKSRITASLNNWLLRGLRPRSSTSGPLSHLAPSSGKQKETTLGSGPMQRIVNVTTPTLTAYLPDPAKATDWTAPLLGCRLRAHASTRLFALQLYRHVDDEPFDKFKSL